MALRLSHITGLKTLTGKPLKDGEWFDYKTAPFRVKLVFLESDDLEAINSKARPQTPGEPIDVTAWNKGFALKSFVEFDGLTRDVAKSLWPGLDEEKLEQIPAAGVENSLEDRMYILRHPEVSRWILQNATNREAYTSRRSARQEKELGNSET